MLGVTQGTRNAGEDEDLCVKGLLVIQTKQQHGSREAWTTGINTKQ